MSVQYDLYLQQHKENVRWYEEHKDYIKFSDTTRKTVENILDKIRDKISGELAHHGIKGQKWGVRNGPPYPLGNDKTTSIVIKEILNGTVSKTINREKQLRHTEKEHEHGKSYIYGGLEQAQKLVDELSGTGEAIMVRDKWINRERVKSNKPVEIYVDVDGNETETKNAMIIYSKTGSHIYPREER